MRTHHRPDRARRAARAQVGATVAAPGLTLDFDEGRLDARKDHARPDGRNFRAAREKASRARHAAPQAPPLEMDAE